MMRYIDFNVLGCVVNSFALQCLIWRNIYNIFWLDSKMEIKFIYAMYMEIKLIEAKNWTKFR